MSNDNSKKAANIIDVVLIVLLIVFIILKVIGVISWSWWLVLLPLWVGIGVFIFDVIALLLMGSVIRHSFNRKDK